MPALQGVLHPVPGDAQDAAVLFRHPAQGGAQNAAVLSASRPHCQRSIRFQGGIVPILGIQREAHQGEVLARVQQPEFPDAHAGIGDPPGGHIMGPRLAGPGGHHLQDQPGRAIPVIPVGVMGRWCRRQARPHRHVRSQDRGETPGGEHALRNPGNVNPAHDLGGRGMVAKGGEADGERVLDLTQMLEVPGRKHIADIHHHIIRVGGVELRIDEQVRAVVIVRAVMPQGAELLQSGSKCLRFRCRWPAFRIFWNGL